MARKRSPRGNAVDRFVTWSERRSAAKPSFRGKRQLPRGSTARRVQVVLVLSAIVASLCAGRAIQIQVFDQSAYAAAAAQEMTTSRPLQAMRGQITDRNGQPLALSVPAVTIIADPEMIATNGKDRAKMTEKDVAAAKAAPGLIAAVFAKHLGGEPGEYLPLLTKQGSRYSIVARQIMASTFLDIQSDLREKDLIGVYREQAPYRTYPNGSLAANLVGFVDGDGKGAGGLEYALNRQLAGTPGREVYETSPNGRIPLGSSVVTPAVDGNSYGLTIDGELQWTLERRLSAQVTKAGAAGGTGIVMNVKTGEILALANTRTFDPNNPGKSKPENLGNDAVMGAYEPGSVQKLITMAALLDTGTITNDTKVEVPNTIQSADRRIKDAWEHGTLYLTARGVLAHSSNVGTVKLTRNLSKEQLVEYYKRLHLGQRPGLPLAGEGSGQIPNAKMSDQTRDQISFGQGLSVTSVQMAAAVAALVNGGVYHQPTVIKSTVDGSGKMLDVPRDEPQRVVSQQTSAAIREMMEAMVLQAGTGARNLKLEGFRSGAKTGTAERIDPTCGCYRGFVVSLVGVAPIEDPQILTYIVIDRPGKGFQSGHIGTGPVYTDVMQLALVRYGIRQSDTEAPKLPTSYKP